MTALVHERVRDYLTLAQLDKAKVARDAGIPIPVFNAMLRGRRKIYADDLRAICLALRVSADRFVNSDA